MKAQHPILHVLNAARAVAGDRPATVGTGSHLAAVEAHQAALAHLRDVLRRYEVWERTTRDIALTIFPEDA